MFRVVCALLLAMFVFAIVAAPASAQGFLGPANGGGWSGTVSGTNLVYNGVAYPIVNGRVNFPDCTTYIVAPNGALMGGSVTPNCTAGPVTLAVTWATPAPVTTGTALSATQLNAMANVAGTFVYTPPAGTVMSVAGTRTLSTTFTPTDTVNYATTTRTVTLQINAAPSGFVGPADGGGWSGTISGTNLLYNGVAYPIVNGRVNFPNCTTYIVAPNGALMGGAATPNCTIGATTPVIAWPTPAPITQGAALTAVQLNATTTVAGSFVYTPAAGTVLPAGSYTLSTTFTPSNTTLYTSASKTVTQVVNAPAGLTTPVITWPTPAPITQGTALSATQLNATTTVAGSFVYTPGAGTVLPVGSYTLTTTFTPTNTALYTSAGKSVTQVVNTAGAPEAAFWVYDANDVVVGALRGTSTVTFEVGGVDYSASVGPDGWNEGSLTLYYFNSTCTGASYLLRSWSTSGTPQSPAPIQSVFFRALTVLGSAGYHGTGTYLSRVVASAAPNVWWRENGAGSCTALDLTATAWFEAVAVVPLPVRQLPFTIK